MSIAMSGLQDIKISTRLIGLGVLVVVFMVGLAALGMHTATTIYDTQKTVISITEIVSDVQDIVHDWKNILVRGGDPVEFEKYQADINTHIQIADKRFDEISVNYKRHGGDLGQFYQAESSFQSMINKYQESVRFYEKSNNMRNVLKVDAMVKGADKATLDSLKKIANDFNTKTDVDMSAEIMQMIVISAIGIVSTCLLLFLVIRHITSGLKTLSRVADKVAEGDLRTKIIDLGKNELGFLAKGFSRMAENLTKSMRQNQATSNEMFSTIEQLTQATHKQAASSSQQAASVNQTTSAVAQIKATFAQTLEKVQQLGEKAEHVHSEGQRGTESLDQD